MLSVIILSKNEEDVIADCIESIKDLANEIIVIDSKSSDRTVDIAKRLGCRVIIHEFKNFSDSRNFVLSHARGQWVLYLDADERATPEFIYEVRSLIRKKDPPYGIGGYYIKRKTYYLGRDWDFTDRVQRLFYKKFFIEWHGKVHESPRIKGKYIEITAPILHFTHRDLSKMLEKTNEWSEFEAELRLQSHHPRMNVIRFLRVMITGFIRSYVYEKGYKNGTEGIIESVYQSYSMFITYAKLWEKQNK